jgi:hypothetical protein
MNLGKIYLCRRKNPLYRIYEDSLVTSLLEGKKCQHDTVSAWLVNVKCLIAPMEVLSASHLEGAGLCLVSGLIFWLSNLGPESGSGSGPSETFAKSGARNYRPSFHENKPKTLVFND